MRKNVLFLTRRFPPSVGGIETCCYELHKNLCKKYSVTLIAQKYPSLFHLIWFMPWAYISTIYHFLTKNIHTLILADGVVGSLAPYLKPFSSKTQMIVMIYGVEATYKNKYLRQLMVNGAKTAHYIATISQNTQEKILRLGIPSEKIKIIYLGIEPLVLEKSQGEKLRNQFENQYSINFNRDKVLLNFGRLIPRKGVYEFLKNGFPLLDPYIKLVIGGSGPDYVKIQNHIQENNLNHRILLLHQPDNNLVAMLRQSAHLFIFPNVKMENDIEGFGMTQLESMYSGIPVVAFAVDALVESVRKGGYLIEPGNYVQFTQTINRYFLLSDSEKKAKIEEAIHYVHTEYSWEKNASEFSKLIESHTY